MKKINIFILIVFIFNIEIYLFGLNNSKQILIDKYIGGEEHNKLINYCEKADPPVIFSFRELIRFINLNPSIKLLDCIVRKSAEYPDISGIYKYEKGSFWISENVRCYFKEEGDSVKLVITNLDEKGKRIGGEVTADEQVTDRKYDTETYERTYEEYTKDVPERIVQEEVTHIEREAPPAEYVISYGEPMYYPIYDPCLILSYKSRNHREKKWDKYEQDKKRQDKERRHRDTIPDDSNKRKKEEPKENENKLNIPSMGIKTSFPDVRGKTNK